MSNAQQPRSPAPVTTAEPTPEPPRTAAPEAEADTSRQASDDLRCTLCGLRACWTG